MRADKPSGAVDTGGRQVVSNGNVTRYVTGGCNSAPTQPNPNYISHPSMHLYRWAIHRLWITPGALVPSAWMGKR
jgi:hypothetical protein